MKKFSEMSTYGMWKDKPQTDIERYEEMERIEALNRLKLSCGGDVTYGSLDLREDKDA